MKNEAMRESPYIKTVSCDAEILQPAQPVSKSIDVYQQTTEDLPPQQHHRYG